MSARAARGGRMLAGAAVLAVLFGADAARGRPAPSFQELEEALTCQCGCGLTVHACNHVNCPSALPLRAEIREQMARGLDRDRILAHFVAKYGEKILSAPTARGFNLLAWVTPFVLLALAGAIVGVRIARWSARGADAAAGLHPPADGEPWREVLERELRRFDG